MPQGMSQPPQCIASVIVSTHVAPQPVKPISQVETQTPDSQTSVGVHALSQPPQCIASVIRSTHVPPQEVGVGAVQGGTQEPKEQMSVPVHALPQLPQFAVSVATLVQVSPQRSSPEGQLAASGAALSIAIASGLASPVPPSKVRRVPEAHAKASISEVKRRRSAARCMIPLEQGWPMTAILSRG